MPNKTNNSVPDRLEEIYFNPEAGSFKSNEEPASASDTMELGENESSNPPSPAKEKKFLFRNSIIILLSCCLVAVGFLIWRAYGNIVGTEVDLKNVTLEIKGPKEIISGESIEYKIVFENKSPDTLKEAEITLRFPTNFTALEFQPEPVNKNQQEVQNAKNTQYFWQFSNIPSRAKKEIIIVGQIFGEIGDKQIITSSCHYQPENFSSDFKISSILETEISDTLVSLRIDAPAEIINNAEIKYQIKISSSKQSSATTSPNDLQVFVEYPQGFILSDIKPKTNKEKEQEYWLISSLSEEQIITITGQLAGEAGEYKELLVKVGYYVDGEFQLQTGESFITIIIKPELDVSLHVNGLEQDSLVADWNDEISYSLIYTNQGEVEFSDIILKLNFSGNDIVNWQSVDCDQDDDCPPRLSPQFDRVEAGGEAGTFLLTSDDGDSSETLIWTREQLPNLETLIPGASGIVKLRINLKENPIFKRENYHLIAQAMADVKVDGLKESIEIKSNPIDIKIRTKTELKTEARYYTDEYLKIGSGPLPPLVGAATNFRIFWQIDNTSNAIKDVQVTAILPDNVIWANKFQTFAGNIKYNSFNRRVTWTVLSVLANSTDIARANFEISVTPKLSQLGEYLTLTQETILEATDNFTNESVSDVSGYLTSELENDLRAQGKGRVE